METKDENAVTEAATALLTIAMTPVEISSLDNVRSDNIDNTNTKKRGRNPVFHKTYCCDTEVIGRCATTVAAVHIIDVIKFYLGGTVLIPDNFRTSRVIQLCLEKEYFQHSDFNIGQRIINNQSRGSENYSDKCDDNCNGELLS